MAKKKSDSQDKPLKAIILATAILNLVRALLELISKITE